MGAITPRTNKDGSTSYKAQVRVRKRGKVMHQETKTFDRKQAAQIWVKKRETELAHVDGLRAALQENPLVTEIISKRGTSNVFTGDRDVQTGLQS